MNYSFQTTVNASFDRTMQMTVEALGSEGFGIVSQLDLDKKFKDALGKEFKRYTILGACMTSYAYQAVSAEELIGLLLPCNLVVIERDNETTLVASINPEVTMQSVHNSTLIPLAADVAAKLQKVISKLGHTK